MPILLPGTGTLPHAFWCLGEYIWQLLKAEASAFLVTGDQKLLDQLKKGTRGLTARSFAELLGD